MPFPTSFPPQHQDKQPGLEYTMTPLPIYDDDQYIQKGTLLQDQVALITGGDSGIGRAVSIAFAKQGAHVVIVYYNESQDAEATQSIVESLGRECLLIQLDISIKKNCELAINQAINHFISLDILVNNAAIQTEHKKFEEIPKLEFDRTFKTNFYGAFHMTQAALPPP